MSYPCKQRHPLWAILFSTFPKDVSWMCPGWAKPAGKMRSTGLNLPQALAGGQQTGSSYDNLFWHASLKTNREVTPLQLQLDDIEGPREGHFFQKKLAVNFQVQACRIFRLLILVAVVYVEPKYAKMRFLMLAQYVNGNPICYHVWFSKIVHVCFDLSESPDPVVIFLQTELAWSRGRWVCDNFSVYSLVLFFIPSFVIFLQFCCIQSISIVAKTVLIPDLDTWGYPDRTSTRHELLRHSSDIWRPPGHELSRRIGITKGDFMALEKIWKHPSLNIPKNSHLQSIGGVQAALEFVLSMSFCGRTSTSWLLPSPVSAQNPWCNPCLYFQGVQHDNSSKSKMQDRHRFFATASNPCCKGAQQPPPSNGCIYPWNLATCYR